MGTTSRSKPADLAGKGAPDIPLRIVTTVPLEAELRSVISSPDTGMCMKRQRTPS